MAHIFANGVLETCTLTGTGAATLTGAVAGYKRFSAVCATSDTVHYRIEAVNGLGVPTGLWELGRGTYSAANTLTRTTVYESSNANALENFAGAVRVSITVLSPTTASQVAADWIAALTAVDIGSTQTITGQKRFNANPSVATATYGWAGVVPVAVDVGTATAVGANTDNTAYLTSNAYFNGTSWKYKNNGNAAIFGLNGDGTITMHQAASGTGGANVTLFNERFKILSNGDVILNGAAGWTYCQNSLLVRGAIYAHPNTGYQFSDGSTGYSSDGGGGYFCTKADGNPNYGRFTDRFWHQSGSWVGWQIQSSDGKTLRWSGQSGTLNADAFTPWSDHRLKTDLTPIQDARSKIKALTGYEYTMIKSFNYDGTNKRRAGLIAQEVLGVLPVSVELSEQEPDKDIEGPSLPTVPDPDDPTPGFRYTLDYNGITALLVNDNNAMADRIDELERKASEAETRILALEDALNRLLNPAT